MNKSFFSFIGGICTGIFLMILYLHRRVIKAALCGEKLPKAPKICPAFKSEDDDE